MGRYISGGASNGTNVAIGEVARLFDAAPGFIPCDGTTLYTEGTIYNDMWVTTTITGPNSAVSSTDNNIASSGSVIVAVNQSTGVFYRSTNGTSWAAPASPPSWAADYGDASGEVVVTWDGTRFLAFAVSQVDTKNGIYCSTSTDGDTWGAPVAVFAPTGTGTAGGVTTVSNVTSGMTLVISESSGAFKATDGATWSSFTPGVTNGYNASWTAFGATGFMANNSTALRCSTDNAVTWVNRTPPATVATFGRLALGTPSGTIIASAITQTGIALLRSTDDGVTWAFAQSPNITTSNAPLGRGVSDGTKFYFCNLESSDDGLTWTRRSLPSGLSGRQRYVTIGANKFAAYGNKAVLFSGSATGVGVAPLIDNSNEDTAQYYLRVA